MTYIQPILCLQTPTRAAMRLCAFRLVVFISVPPLSTPPLFWRKEWKAGDKLMETSCFLGRVGESVAVSAQTVQMLAVTEEWDACRLWMGKRPLQDGLVTQGSCRPGVKTSADALSAWRRRSPVSGGQYRNGEWDIAHSLLVLGGFLLSSVLSLKFSSLFSLLFCF